MTGVMIGGGKPVYHLYLQIRVQARHVNSQMEFRRLTVADSEVLLPLVAGLNPDLGMKVLRDRLTEMFGYENYYCFGLFASQELVAVSSGWLTTRLYSGRQLELDNVVVKPEWRNRGIGADLNRYIEDWAKNNACQTCELNSYVTNTGSHRFYFRHGYSILGYHFYKRLEP